MFALPLTDIRPARMLAAGNLTVTFTSKKSGKHITLRFAAKVQKSGRWSPTSLDDATHIFVNGLNWGDRVGTLYATGAFYPTPGADPSYVWCARQLIKYLTTGEHSPQCEIAEAAYCGRCSRGLTDPKSIERGIGPECFGKLTGSVHKRFQSLQTTLDV